MAQIKRDHGGYHSSGLWIKFQQPNTSINDDPKRKSNKKDTVKWCKGKVGDRHQFYQKMWKSNWNDNVRVHYITKCFACKKEVYKKRTKSFPLYYEINEIRQVQPIQVKFNGKAIPIDTNWYRGGEYCEYCQEWHYDKY